MTAERKLVVYYSSGTGNSLRVATWLREQAAIAGVGGSVIALGKADPATDLDTPDELLVGLVLPTHGFIAPWSVLRFAARLPKKKNARAFCIATRAGLKFGRLFTPGISGTATFLLALILALRGYAVRGVTSIDMPSNWTAFHPGLKPENARAIIARARPKADAFITTILGGRRSWFTGTNFYEAIFGTLLLPVSLGYLMIGRFFLAKLFFASNDCNGCGLCARICPHQALTMIGRKKPRPFWTWRCESCMRCMALCPVRAIEAGHSWAILLGSLTSGPVIMLFLARAVELVPGLSLPAGDLPRRLLYLLAVYPVMFFSYWCFYWLGRIPAINAIYSHTTLTRFYRRYSEPDVDKKELLG